MYCIEESTCDIVEIYWLPPQWLGAREIALPLVLPLNKGETWAEEKYLTGSVATLLLRKSTRFHDK